MKRKVGIYKITSPTGRVYIGQSWDIIGRWEYYIYPTCKSQKLLYRSLIKHGSKNHLFEIIHELPSDVVQSDLDRLEILYWQQHIECGCEMLNIKEPGSYGRHSEETKQKISEKMTGRKLSEATRLKFSQRMLGTKMSDESRQKLSISKKGKPGTFCRPHTEETKRKIREKRAKQIITDEHKQRIRDGIKMAYLNKKQNKAA